MAHALSNTRSGFSLSAIFTRLADAWKTAGAQRAVFNRTYNELQALSDRELADIGIARVEIADISRQEAVKAA
ncbi:MAG: DUF1127 domain-containing protein [Rhodobacteraceae bacterium]|nr:MAG: DUF1127 domain-containing protein [Paracoccaceae bacterium]